MAALPTRRSSCVGVFALAFVAQGVKICVDTVVQRTIDDNFRGRVFTVYDTLFNVAFVAAAVVTALDAFPSPGTRRCRSSRSPRPTR